MERQSRKIIGRTGKNLPKPLCSRLVLTAQELLQPLSFSESRERCCEYKVCRGLLLPPVCVVHLSCNGLVPDLPQGDGGERRWTEGKEAGKEHHCVVHAAT